MRWGRRLALMVGGLAVLGGAGCASSDSGRCKVGESPPLSVRLAAAPAMPTQALSGGQSSTVLVVGTHGEHLFSPMVSPAGPMAISPVALNALTLVRRGAVKVTAVDAVGKPYQATVSVDC